MDNLDYIKNFKLFEQPMKELVGIIMDSWADYGYCRLYKYAGRYHFELHTVGWANNENIINAFNQIELIEAFQTKWEAGGHFYYSFGKDIWEGNKQ